MNIGFQIKYRTVWGENVRVALTWMTKTGKETCIDVALATIDGEKWRGETVLPSSAAKVRYQYLIIKDGQVARSEWNVLPRELELPKGKNRVQTIDHWRDCPEDSYRYTSAFTEAFVRHEHQAWPESSDEKTLILRVFAPEVPAEQTLALLGSAPILGNW